MHALLLPLTLAWADKAPEPEDVVAGWTAFALFLLLLAAVVVLGVSLTRHLKTADQARDAGVLPSTKEERAAGLAGRDGSGPDGAEPSPDDER